MSLYSKANWKTVLNNYSMNYLWETKKKIGNPIKSVTNKNKSKAWA